MKRDLVRRLKLQHLRIIAAVNSKGSLLKASAALNLTQPALTRALHEIETIVGERLFQRHAKGVVPNQLGELMAETAQRVLADIAELERDIDAQTDTTDLMRIGVLPSAAVGVLPGVIAQFHLTFPKVHIKVTQGQTDEMLNGLSAGELDFVIGRLYPPATPDVFERVELFQDRVVLLARNEHPIFAIAQPTPEQLSRYELVLHSRQTYGTAELEELIHRFNLRPDSCLESNSLPLLREVLLATDMMMIVPRLMLLGDLRRGNVREVIPLPIVGGRPSGLITRRDARLSHDAERFIALLRQQLVELGDFVRAG